MESKRFFRGSCGQHFYFAAMMRLIHCSRDYFVLLGVKHQPSPRSLKICHEYLQLMSCENTRRCSHDSYLQAYHGEQKHMWNQRKAAKVEPFFGTKFGGLSRSILDVPIILDSFFAMFVDRYEYTHPEGDNGNSPFEGVSFIKKW